MILNTNPLAFLRKVCIIKQYGLVAQLGERSVRIREVEGSNPFRSTKKKTTLWVVFLFAVACPGRANFSPRGPEGIDPARRI